MIENLALPLSQTPLPYGVENRPRPWNLPQDLNDRPLGEVGAPGRHRCSISISEVPRGPRVPCVHLHASSHPDSFPKVPRVVSPTRDAGRHPRHGCSAGSCSPADDTGIAEPHHLGRRESPTRRAPPPYPPRRGHRAAHRWGRPAQTGAGAGRNIPSCSTIVPRTTMRGCRAAHPSVRRERHMSRRLPIRSATRLVSAER